MKYDDHVVKESAKIRIEIGELVLHGFDNSVKYKISSQIEQELVRLIKENGLPTANGLKMNKDFQINNMQTKNSNISPGSQVAQSVYKMMWSTNQSTSRRKN